jgi:hypothetical protein
MRVANTTRLLLIPHARCKSHALVFLLCAPVVNATRPLLVSHALFWKQFLCIQMTEIKTPCFEGNIPCFRAKFLVLKQLFRPKTSCCTAVLAPKTAVLAPKNFLCCGVLDGGRGCSGRGNGFCSAPCARRGGAGCNGLSWDLVFRALSGATGGGSGAPTTRWDGGNRQAPPGTNKLPRRRTDSPLHHLFSVETSCRTCI